MYDFLNMDSHQSDCIHELGVFRELRYMWKRLLERKKFDAMVLYRRCDTGRRVLNRAILKPLRNIVTLHGTRWHRRDSRERR